MSGPLNGVKVIDLSLLLPGPLCSMYLGDMGAEVIKIENPRAYDGTRAMVKSESGMPGLFFMTNRNKKAITLNLKKSESKEILFKLLEKADILLEGFRPDALDEMGIGYDVLKEKFPRLIYCGISGYGTSGPYKDWAGHDGNYLALAGVLDQLGEKDKPSLAGFQLADIGGGTLVALASILAALYSREKTGKGQKIDVSMMESSLQFISLYAGIYLSNGKLPERGNELLSGKLSNYHIYKTKENRFVFLGALEERFFRTFLRQIGKEHLLEEGKNLEEISSEMKETLTEYFEEKTFSDLDFLFQNPDCCLTPIKNLDEVLKDPHLMERSSIFKKNHPTFGEYFQFAAPFRFSNTPCEYTLHPPEHGEHNFEIFTGLGYSKEEIEKFKKGRII
ncbi:MAG TPA: CoA transferase [Leptospiraceae bacterium]|nr:CoA transferase [Leptospiraceae bacterium]HMW04468.1 CoA transferase [Leptospiraceae bacterium]HMX31126.1 CoA transferase [Leptospiraceae bacterium]HMY30654.1 CoA transferase [Leptospiraceae bacterium]HMZ65813.1 CoA transferase [Leptospiraceae bacterium]